MNDQAPRIYPPTSFSSYALADVANELAEIRRLLGALVSAVPTPPLGVVSGKVACIVCKDAKTMHVSAPEFGPNVGREIPCPACAGGSSP